jgi:hypothetical protein
MTQLTVEELVRPEKNAFMINRNQGYAHLTPQPEFVVRSGPHPAVRSLSEQDLSIGQLTATAGSD